MSYLNILFWSRELSRDHCVKIWFNVPGDSIVYMNKLAFVITSSVVYSINLLKQLQNYRTRSVPSDSFYVKSSLEPIKCIPLSRESAPKFGRNSCISCSIKLLKRWSFRKKIKKLLLNFLLSEDDYVEVFHLIKILILQVSLFS